jgi:hypothetical protein
MKRYKEFLIDVLTKSYQVIFASLIVGPLTIDEFSPIIFGIGFCIGFGMLYWAGFITWNMKE